MGLRPTHGDESALLRFIDSKQVTRDFRGSVIDSMTMSAPWTRVNFGGAETNQKRLGRKEPNNGHYRMRLSPGLSTNCFCGYRNWGTARAGIAAPRGSG